MEMSQTLAHLKKWRGQFGRGRGGVLGGVMGDGTSQGTGADHKAHDTLKMKGGSLKDNGMNVA